MEEDRSHNQENQTIGLPPSKGARSNGMFNEINALLAILERKGLITKAEFDEEYEKQEERFKKEAIQPKS